MARDAFVNAVSDEKVREKLRDKNPATLSDAVTESKRLTANKEIGEGRTKAVSTKGENELQQLKEKVRQLSMSKEPTSTQEKSGLDFRQKQKGNWKLRSPREPPTCWRCAMKGHVSRWCPFTNDQIEEMKKAGKIPTTEPSSTQSN